MSLNNGSFLNLIQQQPYLSVIILTFRITRRLFTKYRIAHGLLYGFQQLLAFTLMLIVMTFNGNLILSVVIGEAVGYFLFTGSPLFEAKMQECC